MNLERQNSKDFFKMGRNYGLLQITLSYLDFEERLKIMNLNKIVGENTMRITKNLKVFLF